MTPQERDAIRDRLRHGLNLDLGQALRDANALLVEVDRLTEYTPWITDKWVEGYDAAVARIRAGVEGLRDLDKLSPMEQRVWGEACAAVLRIIDGGEG